MSDTRMLMIGVAFVFAGFLVLGVVGPQFTQSTIQQQEFGSCFEYADGQRLQVDCDEANEQKVMFFALVLGLIGAGIAFLVMGVRGRWDQQTKEGEMVGPGG